MVVHTFKTTIKFGSPEEISLNPKAKLSLLQNQKPRLRLIRKPAIAQGPFVPKLKLRNGEEIPMLGVGTLTSKPGEAEQSVKTAIASGYRHIDCASSHMNEAEVGRAIKSAIEQGLVKREELFITSKLWNTDHHPESVEPALRNTLSDLGVDYLDLYLIEYPTAQIEEHEHSGEPLFSEDPNVTIVDTWKAMEELVQKGMVKSIGVSNFNSRQLENLLQNCRIPPVLNQIEVNPYMSQEKLVKFCKDHQIAVTGYSPFRSGTEILKDPKLIEISFRYNKSVPQIILRWLNQRGIVAIPKSVNNARLQENLSCFDFRLTEEEMEVISWLNRNDRFNTFEIGRGHREYPFHIEY